MPANLPPQYFEAEKEYKNAKTSEEKIAALEAMLAIMPHHKGTDKLRAALTRKIAQIKTLEEARRKTRRGSIFNVDRQGAAQVLLVGLPNSGKSSMLSSLTNASPEVADYPFTTTIPVIGMMAFEDIQIQVVDLPPLEEEIRKLPYYNLLRNADALLLVVDASSHPEDEVQLILDMLKDSSVTGEGTSELKREVFETVEIVRVYTKIPGKKPDMESPFVLPRGSTVLQLARDIHHDFAINLRFARIWGSAKFDGQTVQKDYILQDKDIVEMHI
ncbi:MAG: hypothetical protein B6D63_03610 [Candidatus Latescibacteria bacterium 4484_7]|nr:MAG: hypothetical protein B6D63_03610 [Candidatus Latescibacteria bacterium 4484_7]